MNKVDKKAKSIFFATLGCRLNQAETDILKTNAISQGFRLAINESETDIFVLNSCSVTNKAQGDTEKILKKINSKYPQKEVIITGCGAKKEYEKYGRVVLNSEKQNLFDGIKNIGKEQNIYSQRTRLMYKVQDGCNNFCSYCIVPYLRGREHSLEAEKIMRELKTAEKSGIKEVVLCGVNIGKYDYKGTKLAGLIENILKNTAFLRIRLSSINPDDFSDDLVALWAQNDRLCPHFHISLQSGSDSVLTHMGRKYNTKQYSSLISKLRKAIPEVQITTDIIVGFPGETEEELTETIKFVEKIQLLKVHVFRYSPREGTRAAKMDGQISEKVKKERAVKLQKLEARIRQRILKSCIGEEVEVLFEQKKNGHYSGFTPNYIKVIKKSQKDITNQIVRVKIKGTEENEIIAN